MNGFDYSGKTVLVTGGTKGIGRRIAERFLAAGARVFVCGRSAPDTPPSAGGRTATFIAADLRDIEQVDAMLATARAATGSLDVLVNNAGGSPFVLAADASPGFTESIVRLNLIAPLQLAQRVNAIMQSQPHGGVMLFIASVSASRPSPGTAAYGAAKAGLVNAVTSLAVEWAPRVRVCAISPSLVHTESATEGHYGDDAALDAIRATIPAARLATPDDVASACLFLASPDASYTSGANLRLDGGGERPAFLAAAQMQAR
ncbi:MULTISPECIES: SDR family oxidoreductase [unclassified Burkholderia]|uniref:SDR family oxidoreductase n=1 Tax=unclassified Burkholderia TaxID=2613784 RepID=UPI000F56D1A1|nr:MULTISPECIES: SDR family oxidoreductase [unclassified Burkholderia]RQR96370.1 short chain dehydrogenase [Burkholderia sp. Bp8994]RQS25736.1 short chain dehydrogenase [Burkholderia sp. Bp8995]RQS44201.1 short chain dehydrogenase [Burkholderia sp. Bp8989]RQZ40487.1 short chain dehydrogenase [Burkholderia sp. Bp9090]